MGFPVKNDLEKADEFLIGFFNFILENFKTAIAWGNLNMVVGVKILDLNLNYTINCYPDNLSVVSGFPEEPDASYSFDSDIFHGIFTSKLNPIMSLARGVIKTKGPIGNILAVANILPQNIEAYQNYLESQGFKYE